MISITQARVSQLAPVTAYAPAKSMFIAYPDLLGETTDLS